MDRRTLLARGGLATAALAVPTIPSSLLGQIDPPPPPNLLLLASDRAAVTTILSNTYGGLINPNDWAIGSHTALNVYNNQLGIHYDGVIRAAANKALNTPAIFQKLLTANVDRINKAAIVADVQAHQPSFNLAHLDFLLGGFRFTASTLKQGLIALSNYGSTQPIWNSAQGRSYLTGRLQAGFKPTYPWNNTMKPGGTLVHSALTHQIYLLNQQGPWTNCQISGGLNDAISLALGTLAVMAAPEMFAMFLIPGAFWAWSTGALTAWLAANIILC